MYNDRCVLRQRSQVEQLTHVILILQDGILSVTVKLAAIKVKLNEKNESHF